MKKSYIVSIPVSSYRDICFKFETGAEAMSFLETATEHIIIPEDSNWKVRATIIFEQEEEEKGEEVEE